MQKTLEIHLKSHPKSMQKPLKHYQQIDPEKGQILGIPAGRSRDDPGRPCGPVRVPKINKTHTDILQKAS